jgi:hypothetical protein
MRTALDLVSLAGGFGAAWFVHSQLEPWRKATGENGGPPYVRAERIYAAAMIGSFLGGAVLTQIVLFWLG